jgi:flagellar hook protein FlgE
MPQFSIPLSGLKASTTALTVIANDLANMNTTGFKSQDTTFQDLYYQMIGTTGAGDPEQVGGGVGVASITSDFTAGSTSSTGVSTDVADTGAGFFVIKNADGTNSYTRDGTFTLNDKGYLVDASGNEVMGYSAVNGAIDSTAGLNALQLGSSVTNPPVATTTMQLNANLSSSTATGSSWSTTMDVYDSLGESHTVTYTFTKTAANTWSYDMTIPAADVGAASAQTVSSGTLTFDGNGNLTSPSADVSGITVSGLADGASNMSLTWDILNPSTGAATLTQTSADSAASSNTQNGSATGTLSSFTIGSDGTITGTFTNGTKVLGQLVTATFANEQGLSRNANNDYSSTLSSGQAVVGTPGTGGRGSLAGGELELSNVDMATEFSALITAQRAFEANAKSITTFDEISQDTINLKR